MEIPRRISRRDSARGFFLRLLLALGLATVLVSWASPRCGSGQRQWFAFEFLPGQKVRGTFLLGPGGEWRIQAQSPVLPGVNGGIWTQSPGNVVRHDGHQPVAVLTDCEITGLDRSPRGPVTFATGQPEPVAWHYIGRS